MKIIKKNIEYKGEKYRAVIKRNYFQTNYYAVIVKLYKHWYFGHFHIDEDIDDEHTVLYNSIIKIGE